MSITTNPNLESRGASLIYQQGLPNNEFMEGNLKDERRLHRRAAKELREFNQPMVDASERTKMEVKKTLNDRDEQIRQSLKTCRNISAEEALHVPYAHYRYAPKS